MTDTLPWIIAGACATWAIVVTIIWRMDAACLENYINRAVKICENMSKIASQATDERDQLHARIEAACKALEESK